MLGRVLRSILGSRRGTVAPPPPAAPAPAAARFIAFVTAGEPLRRVAPADRPRALLASTRLRVEIPAGELSRTMPTCIVPLETLLSSPGLEPLGEPVAVVIGKIASNVLVRQQDVARTLLAWIERNAGRVRLLADLSDDLAAMAGPMGEPFLAEYQAALARHCELVVPCESLRAQLAPAAVRGIRVIEDPWESPRSNAPREAMGEVPRLLWFGNLMKSNAAAVEAGLLALMERVRGRPLALDFVAAAEREAPLVAPLLAKLVAANPQLTTRFVAWSPEATLRAIDECDFVLLPQDTSSAWLSAKSHNRLVEAIRGGRLAIASPIPSYLELAEGAWVGEDLAQGLEWALANPAAAAERVRAGQAAIANRFSPEAVGRKWLDALQPAATPRRLNLGCGDKILPGYVNVDVATERAGRKPDVVCDLRRLEPFADASVDEVLSVHVVEHFWRWEAVDVLREWLRVLKPGGRMVLECPNLREACRALLEDPAAAGPGKEGQRSTWVLYGDPRWRDPLMVHRWGYTPESLAELMREAGLVNVRQEPAQYKLREPRDMRIVGERPAG